MVGAAVRKLPYCCSVLRQPSSTSVSPCSTWRFSWSRNCRAKPHASGSSVDLQQEDKLDLVGYFSLREIRHGRRAEAECASARAMSWIRAGCMWWLGRRDAPATLWRPSMHAPCLPASARAPDQPRQCSGSRMHDRATCASAQMLRQGLPSSQGRRWSGRRQRR